LQALEKVIKKPQQGIINLIVIDPDQMARMNKQFRGKEWPTDILTFSYLGKSGLRVAESPDFIAGEIYLCLEKIKLYAQERGTTYKEQLEYIIIHGLVHLMGYDHETEEDAEKMELVERKIQWYFS
jgi:probable rRNA maturation factor